MPELGTDRRVHEHRAFHETPNRSAHTATLLGNGKAPLAGGDTATGETASAEIFLPESLLFTPVGALATAQLEAHRHLLARTAPW
jgi:hypothetical protein